MRARAKIWLISAVLSVSACAKEALDETGRNLGGQGNAQDNNPYDDGQYAGSRNFGSAGQPSKTGGAGSSSGGSAGHSTAGSSGSAGSAGASGSGASAGLASSGSSNAATGAAGAKSGSTEDCPPLTRVRLSSGACVDRIEEFAVATSPTSIVTGSDGQVWFDDDESNQLVQLDSAGRVLRRFDCDQGSAPRALVGGRDDALVWYTDAGAKTLNRLTQTSRQTFELKFTAKAIALGEGDLLWMTEAGQALYRVRPYVAIDPYPLAPSNALVIGSDKNVWFPTGSVLAQLNPESDARYFSIGESVADELCAGPDGALWFSDGRRSQIGRMDLQGKLQRFDLPLGSAPTRIIAGPDGAVWFTEDGGDKIGRITVNGVITQYPIPTSGGLPYALTVGGDRNIWFTEKFSGKIGRLIPDPI